MRGITVLEPGLLTSVQDFGRFGQQRSGLSPAGAMDSDALVCANLLVGNSRGEGALECTILGPTLRFDEENIFSITGALYPATLDGMPVENDRALNAPAGSVLKLGAAKAGCRAYIAFAGGLDIPVIANSKSTLLRNGIGGYQGRRLMAGDEIGFLSPQRHLNMLERRSLPHRSFPAGTITLRVIPGPQEDRFTDRGLDCFLNSEYTVTNQCDRMGCRLEGAVIEHRTDGNIISDGIAHGAVQVPTNGQPIIMLSERQSTGGYTKIGTVITVDHPLVAQCVPGTKIRFAAISVEEAQALWILREQKYDRIEQALALAAPAVREFIVKVGGTVYSVRVQDKSATA